MSSRSMYRNVSTNWLVMVWNVAWGIALVPIYLHYLGPANYGIWLLVNSVVGFYGLLDIGIRPALMRHVARHIGLGDQRALNELFNTGWVTESAIGIVVLGLSILLALALPFLPGFAMSEFPDAATLIVLFGLGAAIGLVSGGFNSALGGAERFDVANVLFLALGLVVNVGHLVVLHLGGGLVGMAAVILGVRMLELPIVAVASTRSIPGLRLSPRQFRFQRLRELFDYGLHAFICATGERLRLATDSIVIGAFLPASAVTVFNIGNRPLAYLTDFVRGISNVLTPAFSRQEASQGEHEMRRLLVLSTRATSLLAFLGCLVLGVLGDRLLTLWLGQDFNESFLIMLVLIPAYLVETSLAPTGSFLLGTRAYSVVSRVIIGEGVANLVLSLWLVRPLGLMGVALGTVIPMIAVRLFVMPALVARFAGVGLLKLMGECWMPAVPAVAGAWLVAITLERLLPGAALFPVLVSLLLVIGAYAAIAIVTLWVRQDELLHHRILAVLPAVPGRERS